jgi:hypothetical protein
MYEGRHFQNAYVTRDIEKWVAHFEENAQIDRLLRHEGTTVVDVYGVPATQTCKLAFLWIGGLQYELIQPVDGKVEIYSDGLPADDGLAFHHICTRIDDWDDFRARVAEQPLPIVLERDSEGPGLKFLYLDARATVGHYLEYVWMSDAQWAGMGGR